MQNVVLLHPFRNPAEGESSADLPDQCDEEGDEEDEPGQRRPRRPRRVEQPRPRAKQDALSDEYAVRRRGKWALCG